MATRRRLPLPALLLPLACAALAQRPLTGRSGPSVGPRGVGAAPAGAVASAPVSGVSAEKQRACLLPPDEGPCRAMVPRWYYDRHTQSCQEFTYGGCYGNANNFLTFDDCEKSCWTIKSESRDRQCPRGPRGGRGLEGTPGRLLGFAGCFAPSRYVIES